MCTNKLLYIHKTLSIHSVCTNKLNHKLMKKYRVEQGREFFKLDLNKIKDCLKEVSALTEKGKKK